MKINFNLSKTSLTFLIVIFFLFNLSLLAEEINTKEIFLMDNLIKINELQYEINNLNEVIEENKIIHHERDALQQDKAKLEQDNTKLQKNNEKLKNISLIKINRSTTIFILSALLLLIIIILFLSLIIIRQRKWRIEYYDENSSKFIGQLPERIAETIDRSEKAYNDLEEKNHKQYDNFNQNLQQIVKLINQVNSVNTENVSKINDQLRIYGEICLFMITSVSNVQTALLNCGEFVKWILR